MTDHSTLLAPLDRATDAFDVRFASAHDKIPSKSLAALLIKVPCPVNKQNSYDNLCDTLVSVSSS